jgi:hypothetical protein
MLGLGCVDAKTTTNQAVKRTSRPRRPKRRQERDWVKLAPDYMKGIGAILVGAGAVLHGLLTFLLR